MDQVDWPPLLLTQDNIFLILYEQKKNLFMYLLIFYFWSLLVNMNWVKREKS